MTVYDAIKEEPGPVDDGWWASVLAEEERNKFHGMPRPSRMVVVQSVPAGPSAPTKVGAARSRDFEGPAVHPRKRPEQPAKPGMDWGRIQKLFCGDEIVSLNVTGFNRGGLLVEGDGLHGFVPFSHLVDLAGSESAQRERILENYVGRVLPLKIIECVPEDGRVVFSERAAQAGPGHRFKVFDNLQTGQKVCGQVTNITDFGVFVDLGGVEGLVHISELSWGRVAHPSQIVRLGQELEILVVEIIAERCRVALSLKRLYPNPWLSAERDFVANQVVPATITSVVSYGAFARLDVGVEGLIHASEMQLEGRTVKDILNEGQRLQVRILHVDAAHQRMGLSLHIPSGPCN